MELLVLSLMGGIRCEMPPERDARACQQVLNGFCSLHTQKVKIKLVCKWCLNHTVLGAVVKN